LIPSVEHTGSSLPTFLSVAPLAAVILLVASGRVGVLAAGLIGLALAIPAVIANLPPGTDPLRFLAIESAKGAWLAWLAVSVILAGMFFYQCLGGASAVLDAQPPAPTPFSHDRLYAICFLIGPFAESATGFGVGCIIAVAALRRIGIAGIHAALLGLFSQMLVPWGALAVGTVIGAHLAELPVEGLGLRSAVLTVPLLYGYLLIFWWLATRSGHRPTIGAMIEDTAWTTAEAMLLCLAGRTSAVELAGILATGPLIILNFLRVTGWRLAPWRQVLPRALPYGVLTTALVSTRLVPPLRDGLRSVLTASPFADLPSFPVLYHPGPWLVAIAIPFALGSDRNLTATARRSWAAARKPVLVTLVFVILAQWLSAAGVATALADDLHGLLGRDTVLLTPLFGGLAGFLTGSNAASNGMLMPLQAALAAKTGVAPEWLAAIQNVAGSNLTMLSPIRVAMGAALVGLVDAEAAIYRRGWLLGVLALGTLMAAAALLL
jgi:lactate permease